MTKREKLIERLRAPHSIDTWHAAQEAADALSSMEAGAEDETCPVCAEPFKAGDMCATDIEMGMCHAACLEGSPVVNLDTGEPFDGPIATYPYEPLYPSPASVPAGARVTDEMVEGVTIQLPPRPTPEWPQGNPYRPSEAYDAYSGIQMLEYGRACVNAALEAALAQPASGEGWRTMDSAPKDGTRVLLWAQEWTAPCTGQYYGEPRGWGAFYDVGMLKYQPTHWMPLPTSPREAEGEARTSPDMGKADGMSASDAANRIATWLECDDESVRPDGLSEKTERIFRSYRMKLAKAIRDAFPVAPFPVPACTCLPLPEPPNDDCPLHGDNIPAAPEQGGENVG